MKNLVLISIITVGVLFAGCVSVPPTYSYNGEDIPTVSPMGVNCNKPYELDQDCSGMTGAKRKIKYLNHEVKIAGSQDGTVVMIMGMKALKLDTMKLTLATSALEGYLVEQGFTVIERKAAVGNGEVMTFFLVFDGDAYGKLKAFTVE